MSAADAFDWGGLANAIARGAFDLGVTRLTAGSSPDPSSFIRNNQPLSLGAGSLDARFNPATNTFEVTPGAARADVLRGLNDASQGLANDLGGLASRVAPGFSDLRRSRLAAIENNRRRTVGNLRDNLARRRIAGSSFAVDALSRAEAEFARQASDVEAQSTLEELDATATLLTQRTNAELAGLQALLGGLNFEVETGRALITSASNLLNQNNRLLAEYAAAEAAGRGALAETVSSPLRDFLFGAAGQAAGAAAGGAAGGGGGVLGSLLSSAGRALGLTGSAGTGVVGGIAGGLPGVTASTAGAGGFAFPSSLSGVGSGVTSATGATGAAGVTPSFGGLGLGGALAAAAPAALFAMASMGASAERGQANALADSITSQIEAARPGSTVAVNIGGQTFRLLAGPRGDNRVGRWFRMADGRWVGIAADGKNTPIVSDAPPDVSSQAAAPSYVQNGRLVTGPELTPWQRGLSGAVFGGGGGGDR